MTTTTAAKPFDPVKYKETTREQWQSAAQAWNDWGPLLRAWLGPATEIMLDMAAIEPGHRVLDVAAGAGDQTLQTATRVGPAGRVLATDISPNILAFAEVSARNAGLGNVETKVLDGEELDVPEGAFDAVISRVGLIYFPDQQKALAGMKRALKPGGRVAAIVYSTAENNNSSRFRFRLSAVAPICLRLFRDNPAPSASAAPACWRNPSARPASAMFTAGPSRRQFARGPPPNAYASRRNRSARCIRCSPASTKPGAKRRGGRSSRNLAPSRGRLASKAPARWSSPSALNRK